MSSLFNISAEYLQIINEIEENDGVVSPELEERLYINKNELEDKLKAYNYVIQSKKGTIATIDAEIDRLGKFKTQANNLIERLKKSMQDALLLYGDTGKSGNKQLKYDTLNVYNVYHKPVIIEDEEKFDDERFVKWALNEKLTKEEAKTMLSLLFTMRNRTSEEAATYFDTYLNKHIDKRALKDALKGEEIAGAHIDEEANYIMIK